LEQLFGLIRPRERIVRDGSEGIDVHPHRRILRVVISQISEELARSTNLILSG
jgi:hypothetical protein